MKQWFIGCIILVLGLLLTAGNLKAIGSTKYYVEVQNGGEEYTGHDQTRYGYELTRFDREGNDKELSFMANHQLKKMPIYRLIIRKGRSSPMKKSNMMTFPRKPKRY